MLLELEQRYGRGGNSAPDGGVCAGPFRRRDHSRTRRLRIPYMGDAWFAAFRTAVAQAKRLGLEIYIYDEDGWPSGFASGRIPELGDAYCFKRLEHAASNPVGRSPAGGLPRGLRRRATAVSTRRTRRRAISFSATPRSAYVDPSVPGYGAEISRIRLRALCG